MKPPSDRFLPLALAPAFLVAWMGFVLPALAQEDVPPPPEGQAADSVPAPPNEPAPAPGTAAPAEAPVVTAPVAPTPTPTPPKLGSPQEAYRYQTNHLKDQKKGLEERSGGLDKDQYDIWSRVKGITQYPSVSVHGIGRMLGTSNQFYGPYGPGLTFVNPGLRRGKAYLDLVPMGSVSKTVRWNTLIRFTSNLQTGGSQETMEMLRATLEFNPDFLSATLGDFSESYTPLLLWNRDSLDLKFVPEMAGRWNENFKYERFLGDEPDHLFRGLKVGTDLFWSDNPLLESFGFSTFGHIVRNGYNDTGDGTTFFGPFKFTDWVFGGKASLESKKWDLKGATLQVGLKAFGVILDQTLHTDQPGSPYNPNNSSTWTHQYRAGSIDPELRLGLGDDLTLGGSVEFSVSEYQDDKMDAAKTVSDYAILGGPYLQIGSSRISFNVLDVGPDYFAPMAQMRQDQVSSLPTTFGYIPSPSYFRPLLRAQQFITRVLRPSGYLTFYDRTVDNVFPYGLATPNRRGFGLELNVQTLEKKALKVLGSAYLVDEMNGNLVVNFPQTGYLPVEDPTGLVVAMRSFIYVNLGPSLDLGPLLGWDRAFEIGLNLRYEGTSNPWGDLTSLWGLAGVRVGIFPFLEICGSAGLRTSSGFEAGYEGSQWARSPYLFDNADLGHYTTVDMGGTVMDYSLSLIFDIDIHSKLAVDYSMAYGQLHPYQPSLLGDLHNQFMGLSYEIEF